MKEFIDKVAVITGAASGIGYSLTERSAKEGMKVVLADVEETALKQAEKKIKELGVETLAVKTDVSKAEDVEALAKKALDTFGKVHLLCNNAGVGGGVYALENSLSDWRWVLGVNLWGVIHGTHYFARIMDKQDTECHIVNTASDAGLFIGAGIAYTVSKHGIVALSEALYNELRGKGSKLSVSVLCPGFTKTNLLKSERNRPTELVNQSGEGTETPTPGYQEFLENAKQLIENGMSPQRVAEIVFDAIRQNKFYIIPRPDICTDRIKARMENILEERNPSTVVS
ncbi:MAG TPA: SDR family NAD(P)-dependent oxidoreductase [Dehalococcoidia bacterium]|nr:SDR family NAD(P)-dependent oxidoreductase [Dehalococcoidia bacterium]